MLEHHAKVMVFYYLYCFYNRQWCEFSQTVCAVITYINISYNINVKDHLHGSVLYCRIQITKMLVRPVYCSH